VNWQRVGVADVCLPPKQEEKQGVGDAHESGANSNYDGAYSIGSPPPPSIHDEIGNKAASKATDGKDGGKDGEGNIGHRNTVNKGGREGGGEEGFWCYGFACQNSLDLIENRDVVAILWDVSMVERLIDRCKYLEDNDERPEADSPAIKRERGSVEDGPGHDGEKDTGSHVT
jgi:hypothetical protein